MEVEPVVAGGGDTGRVGSDAPRRGGRGVGSFASASSASAPSSGMAWRSDLSLRLMKEVYGDWTSKASGFPRPLPRGEAGEGEGGQRR